MPKFQMVLALFLILITAFLLKLPVEAVMQFIFIAILTLVLDVAFFSFRRIANVTPWSGLVTGMIIVLVTTPYVTVVEPIVIVLLALISKHFLRFGFRHIFNPAAFGLLFGHLLFGMEVSWWAVTILTPSIFIPFYISGIRIRRYPMIVSFLMVYAMINYAMILDPTVLFFAFVMLPEPITSPQKKSYQILFGIFVGVVSFLISHPLIVQFPLVTSLPDPLIAALLVGNLMFYKLK